MRFWRLIMIDSEHDSEFVKLELLTNCNLTYFLFMLQETSCDTYNVYTESKKKVKR